MSRSHTETELGQFSLLFGREMGNVIDTVGKIFAFKSQGPWFYFRLCQDLNCCATFIFAKVNSAFCPSQVGKRVSASAGS